MHFQYSTDVNEASEELASPTDESNSVKEEALKCVFSQNPRKNFKNKHQTHEESNSSRRAFLLLFVPRRFDFFCGPPRLITLA